MKRMLWVLGVAAVIAGLASVAMGGSATIRSVREIIYPTEFEEQAIGDLDPDRPPIPSSFQTREVGVNLTVDAIVSGGGAAVSPIKEYRVQFRNCMKAVFIIGRTTMVGDIPLKALEFKDGNVIVEDIRNGRKFRFEAKEF